MVIQDAENQIGHTLIAVFHDFGVIVPAEAEVPPNALLPKEWAIFSKWQLTSPDEADQTYKLLLEVFWPDGSLLVKQDTIVSVTKKDVMAFITRNNGFPMGQNGIVRIVMSLYVGDKLAHDPVTLEVRVTVTKGLPTSQ